MMYQIETELFNSRTQETSTRTEWVQADSEERALEHESNLIEQELGDEEGTVQVLDMNVIATREG
ncbi:MAG TPA: hypothetical protein VFA10_14350 [Ktedonobacteraceae bacterium]|nr:hypothetical protein [Ktedonobacteraceae bacterium]